jgi:hypothetical protein
VCDCAGAVCGVDNCGNSCGNCPVNTACSGGVCVSNTAGGNCVDLIDCVFDDVSGCYSLSDETAFDLCIEDCYAASSQVGADEFDAYIGCLQACPQPDGDPNTPADELAYDRCVYGNCSDDEARCALDGSGGLSCFDIIDCYVLCPDGDDDCVFGCYENGTLAAQAALWGINNCLTVECPDLNDDACIDAALQNQCVDFLIACQSN